METAAAQKLAPAAESAHELGPLDELIPVTLILPRDTYLWLREAAYHHKGFVMQEHVNEAVRAHLAQLGPRGRGRGLIGSRCTLPRSVSQWQAELRGVARRVSTCTTRLAGKEKSISTPRSWRL
nr:hypothetical protein [Tanacetum cinerariifolium]